MNRFARGRNTITVCQRSIVIPSAESREAAKKRPAELEGILKRQIHASFIEAGLLDDDAAARRGAYEQRSADDYANLAASGSVRNSPWGRSWLPPTARMEPSAL